MPQEKKLTRIQDFLARHLPSTAVSLLARTSRQWAVPLFAYDTVNEAFEPAAAVEDVDDEVIDALCLASELLNAHQPPVLKDDPLLVSDEDAGFFHLDFTFGPDEDEVYERFRTILMQNVGEEAGITAEFQKSPAGASARITFVYLSDFEYQTKKDFIDTVLWIARRSPGETPFAGHHM